jgi:hypothetical protein
MVNKRVEEMIKDADQGIFTAYLYRSVKAYHYARLFLASQRMEYVKLGTLSGSRMEMRLAPTFIATEYTVDTHVEVREVVADRWMPCIIWKVDDMGDGTKRYFLNRH